MKIIRIGAALAAVTSAGALALTLAPSSADVDSVVGNGTTDVAFEYVLDAQDRSSPTRPGPQQPCDDVDDNQGPFFFETTTLTVGTTGSYRITDLSEASDGFDGVIYAYLSPVPSTLDSTCDFGADVVHTRQLLAGRTYYLALTSWSGEGALGTGFFSISGPGAITVGGSSALSRESALALCGAGADVPAGYTLLEGSATSETLTGTAGNDVIRGLGGHDTIRGLGGDDVLCGGDGQDTIDAGDGNDFVFGEAGQDTLTGGLGDDVVDGGTGNDTLYGNAGADELFGGAGNDVLDGGAGTDVGTDTDPRSIFRNLETVNGPPASGPTPSTSAAR